MSRQSSDHQIITLARTKQATTAKLLSELRRQGTRPSKRYARTLSAIAGRGR